MSLPWGTLSTNHICRVCLLHNTLSIPFSHLFLIPFPQIKYEDKAFKKFEGIVFVTYSTARGEQKTGKKKAGAEAGKKRLTRVEQLVRWASQDGKEEFNGCLVFDEGRNGGEKVAASCYAYFSSQPAPYLACCHVLASLLVASPVSNI